jgi:medium-chain acyl-[acyl-carrier-protein] hydrolase
MTVSANANLWIHRPRPNPSAALRLFCFPYAGGGTAAFRGWGDALPKSVEVCPVQLPGREMRIKEAAMPSVFPLLDALAPAIGPFLDKPFALFGHSMGALVAFELARRIRRDHKLNPECLFVSARVAPDILLKGPPIHDLPEAELIQELIRLNGTDKNVLEHTELMRMVLPTLRADLALHEEYRYPAEPALECPMVAFGGLGDIDMKGEALEAWRSHTAGPFSVRMFSGDHFFINSQRSVFLSAFSVELQRVIVNIGSRHPGRLVSQRA